MYGAFNPSSCELEAPEFQTCQDYINKVCVSGGYLRTGESFLFGVHEDLGLAPSTGLHITKLPFNPRIIPEEENKEM